MAENTLEQAALANTLKSQEQGGAAMSGGALGAGADVPAVLDANPATRQLLEESIATQTGKSVITSDAARDLTKENQDTLQERLDAMSKQAEKSASDQKTTTTTVREPDVNTGAGNTGPTDLELAQQGLDTVAENYQNQMESLKAQSDAQSSALISSIQANYARRKEQQMMINKSALGAVTKAGVRAGRNRYSPEIETGLLSAEESSGISRLADLDREEASLVLQAQTANTDKDFKMLNESMSQLSSLRKEKHGLLMDQMKLAADEERLAMDKVKASMDAQRFNRQEEEATADNISGTVFSMITGDPETDAKMVQEASNQYGIDPNILAGRINEYGQQQQNNDMKAAQVYQSIASNIPAGQSYTDPGSGMTFIGTKEAENIDVVQTIGGNEYKVRYKEIDGELVEIWRTNLGQRWKGGGSGGGGTGLTTSTTADAAMTEAATFLYTQSLKGDVSDFQIIATATALAEEYGTEVEDAYSVLKSKTMAMGSEGSEGSVTPEQQAQNDKNRVAQGGIGGMISDFFVGTVLGEKGLVDKAQKNRIIDDKLNKSEAARNK